MDQSLWLQFETKERYREEEPWIFETLAGYDGKDEVNIYVSGDRATKKLPGSHSTKVCRELLQKLYDRFGQENVKVVQKSIEKNL